MGKKSVRSRFKGKSYWKEKKKAQQALARDVAQTQLNTAKDQSDGSDADENDDGVFVVEEYNPYDEHSYYGRPTVQNSVVKPEVLSSPESLPDQEQPDVTPALVEEQHRVLAESPITTLLLVDISALSTSQQDNDVSSSPTQPDDDMPPTSTQPHDIPASSTQQHLDIPASTPPQLEGGAPTSTSAEDIIKHLKALMPPRWRVDLEEGCVSVSCLSDDMARITQRSAIISFSGGIRVFAHGHELNESHIVYQNTVEKLVEPEKFVREVFAFVSNFRLLEICAGVYQEQHEKWWKSCLDTCYIDNNEFHEKRYKKTLRSNKCEYLIKQPKKFCSECYKVNSKLAKRKPAAAWSSERRTPHKFKPSKSCTSAEKDARDKRKSKDIRNLQRQITRLRQQVDALILRDGVTVDRKLDKPLGDTLERHLEELNKNPSDDPKDRFFQVFMEQQLEARNAKGNKGIRWHPLMVRFALQLKLHSQSSLNAVRNFIRLPSDRLLWDYTHMYDIRPGVHEDFVNEIAEEVASMPHKYQKYHVLLFDECAVSEHLVQRKATGEIVGYQKLGEVQTELLELKRKLEAEAWGHKNMPLKTPPIAKKILSFMVRGTASRVQSIVASYPIETCSKEDLHQYVWEVVESLEVSGICVVAFVCDGGTVNRAFFQMQTPRTQTKEGLILDICNPWDLDRPIFFIADPPHALKTARNCLENSGRKKSRCMVKNGERITWKPIIRLFKWKSDQTVKKLPKLTAACVYLNSFSRMSVPLCTRVMSNSVASQLEQFRNWPETRELSIFKNFQ